MSRHLEQMHENYDEGRWSSDAAFFAGPNDPAAASVVITPGGDPSAAKPWYETVIQTAVPALATAYQQRLLTQTNIARINAGLAPLTAEQYAAVYQPPTAQVTVGPNQSATRAMWFFGVGILGLMGYSMWLRNRRA